MIWLLMAMSQPVPSAEAEPQRVRLPAGEARLSAHVARLREQTGAPLAVRGLWNPRVSIPALDGEFWPVLDALAAAAGGHVAIARRPFHGECGLREFSIREGTETGVHVRYVGPLRVALGSARVGQISVGVVAEPGRRPLAGTVRLSGVEALPRWAGLAGAVFHIQAQENLPARLTIEVVMQAEYPTEVECVPLSERVLDGQEEVRVAGHRLRVTPQPWSPPMMEGWRGTLELEGLGESERMGIAWPEDPLEPGCYLGEGLGQERPGRAISVKWRDGPPDQRGLVLWYAPSVRIQEWTVRFEDVPPAEGE